MTESFGVVVIHYRREHDLARLVSELIGAHRIDSDRIVVVDNGGDVDALDAIRRDHAVRWVRLDNPGYGAAVNAGVRALPGLDLVAVLTHEAVLEPGALDALADVLATDPAVGMVGPVLRDSRSGAIWSAGGVTSRVRRLPRHLDAGTESTIATDRDVEWLDGSCFMVRREEFLDAGGVDERFFLYFEDVDLGWRYRIRGRIVRVSPRAIAWQSPGGHLDQFYATRNPLWLFRKHGLRLPLIAYTVETIARLTIGTIVKPRGARQRQSRRWAGLRQGLARDYSPS